MDMNITCPHCGHKCRMPERMFGQRVQCPACSRLFQAGTKSPPSPETHPVAADKSDSVAAAPPVRLAPAQADATIRYNCPRCRKALESPAPMAGQKLNCPDCGQRLQIPQLPQAPANVPVQVVPAPPTSLPSPPVAEEQLPTVLAVAEDPPPEPERREHCLECGRDITERPRVQTCPDCGSLFCSAMCYREHHYHAHSSRR
jgi:DNA-directed RNA polymerase subunit RPC12/RpoP